MGVEFARAGWHTRALAKAWQPAHLPEAEVVVINTASRACTAEEAYTRVRQATVQLADAGAAIIYKKIDSTLRGPLGAELDAVLDACGLERAVVCPAFPATGRTLRDGVLYVDGVPLAQSAIARDPVTPVQESHLPTLLARTARRPVIQWPRLSALPGAGMIVVDALDDDDLIAIAQAAIAAPQPLLLAGSAGLARPFAAALAHADGKSGAHGAAGRDESGPATAAGRMPVLVVCGSLHPLARAQVRALQAHLASDLFVLLATPETPAALRHPQEAAQTLAQHALAFLQAQPATAVVVTGGDTLASLLAALGAAGVDLERALAPGIALGRVAGGRWAGLRLASKAGGFGDDNALASVVRDLYHSAA